MVGGCLLCTSVLYYIGGPIAKAGVQRYVSPTTGTTNQGRQQTQHVYQMLLVGMIRA